MKEATIGGLYNDLMCLCEIRGEGNAEQNAHIEKRIKEVQLQIQKLEKGS